MIHASGVKSGGLRDFAELILHGILMHKELFGGFCDRAVGSKKDGEKCAPAPKRFAALSGKELVEIVVAGLGGEVGEQQLKRQVVVAYGTPCASKPRDTAGRLGAAKALAQSG